MLTDKEKISAFVAKQLKDLKKIKKKNQVVLVAGYIPRFKLGKIIEMISKESKQEIRWKYKHKKVWIFTSGDAEKARKAIKKLNLLS